MTHRGTTPRNSARQPSLRTMPLACVRHMSTSRLTKSPKPSLVGTAAACTLVLMTSIGQLMAAARVPAALPARKERKARLPCALSCSSADFNSAYIEKYTTEKGMSRASVDSTPVYRPLTPSSLISRVYDTGPLLVAPKI